MPDDRITLIEPFGNGTSNRQLRHGQSGDDAFRDLRIHHPNTNRRAVAAGDPDRVDRPAAFVEGELEAVRVRGDRDGIPLVSKDLILANSRGGRDLMVPNPIGGYLQFLNDKTNAISIWSGPPSDPRRELIGQVLHGARGSSPYRDGDYVPYGAPLVRQSDVGSRGAVHAHIELEPDQYRRYLGDILNDRITLTRRPNQEATRQDETVRPAQPHGEHREAQAPRSPVLMLGSEGARVDALQTRLAALGYAGMDGRRLVPDGDFGRHTDHAVKAFQRAHGLEPVDGKVGPDTRGALGLAERRPLVSEATHPNHALYAEIGRQLPAGTDPRAIANVTLQAMENGITSPQRLERMAVQGNDVFLMGAVPGERAKVDLRAPTPDLQLMSDHMAAQSRELQQSREMQPPRERVPQAVMP